MKIWAFNDFPVIIIISIHIPEVAAFAFWAMYNAVLGKL